MSNSAHSVSLKVFSDSIGVDYSCSFHFRNLDDFAVESAFYELEEAINELRADKLYGISRATGIMEVRHDRGFIYLAQAKFGPFESLQKAVEYFLNIWNS